MCSSKESDNQPHIYYISSRSLSSLTCDITVPLPIADLSDFILLCFGSFSKEHLEIFYYNSDLMVLPENPSKAPHCTQNEVSASHSALRGMVHEFLPNRKFLSTSSLLLIQPQ
jgi:hypothetical protein